MPRRTASRRPAPVALTLACLAGTMLIGVLGGCGSDALRTVALAAQGAYTATLSVDGNLALIGSLNHGASLWNSQRHERLFDWNHSAGDFTPLTAAALSANGAHAATADPRTLVVWDTTSGESTGYWATPSSVMALAIDNDGRRVLMGLEDHSAVLFDAGSGAHLLTLLHDGPVTQVALTLDGETAMTASEDGTARIWNLQSGETLFETTAGGPIRTAALSLDGRWLVTAARNAEVDLFDLRAGTRRAQLHRRNPGIVSARFSRSGGLLALGLVNRAALIYTVANGQLEQRLRLPNKPTLGGGGRAILDLAFGTPTGLYAITGDGQLSTLPSVRESVGESVGE